jgi:hypothetical protein
MAHIKITNGFAEMTDLDFLGKVRLVVTAMTGNSNFTTPDPALASVTTLANEFEQAINDAEAGGSYQRLVRDSKKQELIDTMHNLSNYVLYVSKGDRLIAESSGFTISKDPTPRPPIDKATGLVLTDGANAGEIKLLFTKVQGAKSYMYQISIDPVDETKWVTTYGTIRKAFFKGLESGKKYYVRVVALGTKGQVVYSDAVWRVAQ